jgi:hypothetical protein
MKADPKAAEWLALAVALLLLTGCALPTVEGFTAAMSRFVGASEADLVAGLGVPVRTYEAGGRLFLQYEEQRVVTYPGSPYFGRWHGGWWVPGGFGPTMETRFCSVTFALRGGRVEAFNFRGNDCRAVPQPR